MAQYHSITAGTTHKTMAAAKAAEVRALRAEGGGSGGIEKTSGGQTYFWRTVGVDSYGNITNPRKRATTRRKKNPVRLAASMAGKSTGWMPAKAVRVVRGKGGQARIDIKR